MRSGVIDILDVRDGQFRVFGQNSYNWSSRVNSDLAAAHNFRFNFSEAVPSLLSARYLGFPLRCLSTVCRYKKSRKAALYSAAFAMANSLFANVPLQAENSCFY